MITIQNIFILTETCEGVNVRGCEKNNSIINNKNICYGNASIQGSG